MLPQAQDDKFSIDYSLGKVSGHVALDTVSLGQPPVRDTQQAIGLATNSTADFSTTSCDGVFVSLPCQAILQGAPLQLWRAGMQRLPEPLTIVVPEAPCSLIQDCTLP